MDMTLADVLRRAERLFADRVAVLDGDVHLTYGQLADRCRRLAGALSAAGVGPGDRVATLMRNGHRYLEAYLTVPAMGAVLVPLNNRHSVAEHEYVLTDAGVRALVADEAHEATATRLAPLVSMAVIGSAAYEQILSRAASAPLETPVAGEDDLACLFYTGGTTGRSKGVMLSHRNLLANAQHATIALNYVASDVYLHCAPMFHLADGMSTYAVTWTGGRHAFVGAFEPQAVLATIKAVGVTVVNMVPTMINTFVHHPRLAGGDVSSLRLLIHGGAPIAEDLLVKAIRALGCSFTQVYGMTEAAPLLTALAREEDLVGDARLRSAGREVLGVDVRIVDTEGGACKAREIGEVVARGPNMMLGYWGMPEETALALRDGWYWTGDLAYADEAGYIYVVDRSKDVIISGGENIYSAEVEASIVAHPDVLECAVIGIPDDHWGERVHAVVALQPDRDLTFEQLKAFCAERIAGYKCPKSLEVLPELPKSGAGKILKRDLRDRHWREHARQVH